MYNQEKYSDFSVERQLSFHVIPFALNFKANNNQSIYKENIYKIESSDEWQEMDCFNKCVRGHVHSTNKNSSDTIGRRFKLNNQSNTRIKYNLPARVDEKLTLSRKSEDFIFNIIALEI